MRVLVVDDDPIVRAEIGGVLEFEGATVLEAGTGRQALACLEAGGVDIVISDWRMPELDGFGLLRAMRATSHGARVPFVLLTGSGTPNDDAGTRPDAVLRKPVSIDDLLALVQRLAAGRSE